MGAVKTFTPPKSLETAVLFLIFRRPDTTKQVFEQIRKARPPRLYIAADGPRENVPGEAELVRQTREYVLNNIDWDCEVKTLFRDKNLGCGKAVSEAITWFFEHEEMGIILEDDTLPSLSFFWFCEELLKKYKDDMRVWHIGGYRFSNLPVDNFSYSFSRFTFIWGWATWKNRWKYYDLNIKLYKEYQSIIEYYEFFRTEEEWNLRKKILNRLILKKIDTWDYQWNFCVRINNGLSIIPCVNLVKNIGFGQNATHLDKIDKKLIKNNHEEIAFPLRHPPFVMINRKIDLIHYKKNINKNWFKRFLSKVL